MTPADEGGAAAADGRVPRSAVLVVTLVFSTVCAVPYLLATWRTPPGSEFSGVLLNHFDQNYYQAAQRSRAEDLPRGNRFTSEPDAPGPVSPLYPLLGELQRRTGLPPSVAYHLPRLAAVAALPALLAAFFSLCFPGRRDVAMWGVAIAVFSSGVWILAPWVPTAVSPGLRVPESNVLYSLAVFPHFAVAYVGLTLAFMAIAMAIRGCHWVKIARRGAFAGLLLALSHPFLLLPVGIVLLIVVAVSLVMHLLGGHSLVTTTRLLAGSALFLPAVPFVVALRTELHRFEMLQSSPFPVTPADPWWTWALGYGVATPLVALGVVALVRSRSADPVVKLVLLWVALQFMLVYSPVTVFQRRYIEGLIVPVAGLAAWGVIHGFRRARTVRTVQVVTAVFLAFGAAAGSAVLGLSGQYIEDRYVSLWEHVDRRDVVLAGHDVSSMLPAFSSGTAYIARPVETLRYEEKKRARARYASNPGDAAARQWLREAGITLVVVDRTDPSFVPVGLRDLEAACLSPLREDHLLTIYAVSLQCLRA